MIGALVFVVPAVLAGLLGLLAHGAPDPAAYVPRLRLLCLGSVGLAYLGIAIFLWRKSSGLRRWGSALLALLTLRIAYAPLLGLAVLLGSWLEWAGRHVGAERMAGPLHYALGCFLAAAASLLCLLTIAAAAHPKRGPSIVFLLLLAAAGVLAFAHPDDRAVSPHPFESATPLPAAIGPDYLDVVKDENRSARARIAAAAAAVFHYLQPRSGWGGAVRDEMQAQFRDRPDASLRTRVASLERALLRARRETAETQKRRAEMGARRARSAWSGAAAAGQTPLLRFCVSAVNLPTIRRGRTWPRSPRAS